MRFPLLGTIRLTALAALALTACAIGLGRMNPPTPSWRFTTQVDRVGLPCHVTNSSRRGADYLDMASGIDGNFGLPAGENLYNVSFSPWRDQAGNSQVVGRWVRWEHSGHGAELGLARYSFPDGESLDRISTDRSPIGTPCWFPDRTARILYASGDGHLYRFDFEPRGNRPDADRATHAEAVPERVEWAANPGEGGPSQLMDPIWPSGPALGGRVLVAVSTLTADGTRFGVSRLWWLKLDRDGTRVEESAPLMVHDSPEADKVEERLPCVGRSPSGAIVLSYLTRDSANESWNVRIAPIEIDPKTGIPTGRASASLVVADSCAPIVPAFSPDGRWLLVSRKLGGIEPIPHRIPIATSLETLDRGELHAKSEPPGRRTGL